MKALARILNDAPPFAVCVAPGLFLFLVSVLGLDRVPYFGSDEVYPASTAWTFVTEGRFARDATSGSLGSEVFDAFPPVWIFVLSGVYKLFGVGVWTTRVPAVLSAACAVALLAGVVYRATDSKLQAGVSGSLLALDPVLLQRCRIGRPEPIALLFLMAALFIAASAGQRWARWSAVGLLLALAPAAYQFAGLAVVGVLVGLACTRRMKALLFTCLGGSVGGLLWLAWVWGKEQYVQQQVVDIGRLYAQPLLSSVANEPERYRQLFDFRAPLASLVFVTFPLIAIIVLRRSTSDTQRLLCFAGLTVCALLPAVGMKSPIYFLFLSPFAYACLAAAIASGTQSYAYRTLAAVSAIGGAVILGGLWYKATREWQCRDFERLDRAVGAYIKAGDFVVGPGALWLPTIRRGARFRMTTQGAGPQTEPFQRAFLEDSRALARASIIALDAEGATLQARFPALKHEMSGRARLASTAETCGPSLFSMTMYGPSHSSATAAEESVPR